MISTGSGHSLFFDCAVAKQAAFEMKKIYELTSSFMAWVSYWMQIIFVLMVLIVFVIIIGMYVSERINAPNKAKATV